MAIRRRGETSRADVTVLVTAQLGLVKNGVLGLLRCWRNLLLFFNWPNVALQLAPKIGLNAMNELLGSRKSFYCFWAIAVSEIAEGGL